MRWLVTGGLGVIGSLFARKMLERGDDVEVIDSSEEPRNAWVKDLLYRESNALRICTERLETSGNLIRAVYDCDAVLHAAASTGIPYSMGAPSDDWERNVDGTRSLLEALRHKPKPTVVLSSVKPYRITDEIARRGLNEDDVLDPDEPYAASKAAQSFLAQAYARSYGLPITTFRCSNLYGPAPCHGARHGWLTWLCISAAIGREIRVEGSGNQTRDMLHANDVTTAVQAALVSPMNGTIYNIGGGATNRISVNQAATLLQEMTGVRIVSAPGRRFEDQHVWVDHSRFTAATGWKPNVSVVDGVREVLAWAMRNKSELAKLYADE